MYCKPNLDIPEDIYIIIITFYENVCVNEENAWSSII